MKFDVYGFDESRVVYYNRTWVMLCKLFYETSKEEN